MGILLALPVAFGTGYYGAGLLINKMERRVKKDGMRIFNM